MILQFRQKAQRLAQQKPGWQKTAEDSKVVLEYSLELAQACLKYTEDSKDRVPTKMTINSVLTLLRQYQEKTGLELTEDAASLQDQLTKICTELSA